MGAAKKLLDKKVLRDLVPLNALSSVHLDEISRKAVFETVRSGRYVFKAGDRDYQSVYVLEGKVELIEGGRNAVASVVGGSEASHHPLAHKQPRQLSARASGSVTVARIDSSLLDVLLTWDESSGYDVVEIGAEEDGDWMTRMLQSQAFLQLPPSNIHQLLMRLESVVVRAGDVVVRQDEDGDYFYIVKSGRMAVSRKASARSKEVLLTELGEGACFGEEALVSGTRRNASVTMLTDGSLMRLSKDDFNELLCVPLVHELDYTEAKELVDKGAEWLDVRLPGEFNNQHIKGSQNFPLSALREQADALDADKHYIICCDTGRRSASGAFILSQRGLDVYSLKDGLMDVPGEALDGTADQPPAASSSQNAEIIPFENDRATEEETPVPVTDTGDTERLGKQLQASEAERSTLQAEALTLQQHIDSLESGLRDSEAKHDKLAQQLKEAQLTRESVLETGKQSEKQRTQLVSELERVREDYQQLGQRTSAVAGERDAACRDLEKILGERDALQARLSSQQGEVSEQVREIQAQFEARSRELEAEATKRSEIEAALAGAEKTASEAADRERERVIQCEGLQQQLQDSTEKYKQKQADQSGEYALLVGKMADVEQLLAQSQATEVSLSDSLKEARQRTDEAEQQFNAGLQQERDAHIAEIADLKEALVGQEKLAEQLQERDTSLQEAEKQREEGRQQLVSREHEFESDLGSARQAMARAQSEVDNLKREQQRLLDRLSKMEETRDRERHDHDAETHRLRKEMQAAADGSAEGLAVELEVLQSQVNESIRLRDDLDVSLGERSAQFEEAQVRAEQLGQQLKLAKQSAREAEQQLLEANSLANDEMEIRLNTEQGIQHELREKLERSEQESSSHQETITVINQELEELREAYQQSKQTLENTTDVVSCLEDVQAQLEAVQTERDELVSSADARKNELDQLRAEAEVHRGLEGMSPEDETGSAESEALQQAKQNVEIAVRLRTQAEEQIDDLRKEVEQLKVQLSRASESPAPILVDGAIPSLDERDPHASDPMLPDVFEEEERAPEAAVLLDDEAVSPSVSSGQAPKSGLIKGLLAGLIVGAAVVAGIFWWQAGPDQSDLTLSPPGEQHVTSVKAAPEAKPVSVPVVSKKVVRAPKKQPEKVAVSEAPAPVIKEAIEDKLPLDSLVDRGRQDETATQESLSGVAAISNVSRAFPLAKGMPDVPRSMVTDTAKVSDTQAVVEVTPEVQQEPVVEQPEGRFRDRLSEGGVGPAMVRFRTDHFLMGSSDISPQFDERPQHDTRLRGFAIATREITFSEYDVFARATGRQAPDDEGWGRAEMPVINVDWEDARAYTQWLSTQTGVRYRLPSEAEWEFVARSGTMTRFWWGEDVGNNQANCFDCGSADAGTQTSRVGGFSASPWGVYDMAGNVREWVEDCYTPNYSRAPADGSAVDTGGCTERVVRGGAYSSPSAQLRSASRDRVSVQSRLDNLGFRVVREY